MTFKRCITPLLLLGMLAMTPFAFGQKQVGAACPLSAQIADDTSSGALQIVAIPTIAQTYVYINGVKTANPNTPQIHVCSVRIRVFQAGTPANYGLVTGTGTNCATGQANVTPQWKGTASVTDTFDEYFGDQTGPIVPTGSALCFLLSAAPTHSQLLLTYGIN